MTMDKTEIIALASLADETAHGHDQSGHVSPVGFVLRKCAATLRLAAGASAGAVSGEPVAWQWRGRMRGENWTCWVNGRTPNPIFEEAETRQLYTADQLPALTPEPVKAGPEGAIEDHPRGGTIWEAFSNLYGNGNLDDEDCAYIDRELVKWRGDKFAQSVKAGDEVMREAAAWQYLKADGKWIDCSPPNEAELENTPNRFRPLFSDMPACGNIRHPYADRGAGKPDPVDPDDSGLRLWRQGR
jgi:hypothetical protein